MNNNRGNNRRRGRGNNRPQGGGQQLNRIDSRARGNAPQLLEKYRKMAQDAHLNGDRVQAEYYLQFADHYFRVIADTRLRQEEARQRHSGNGERWSEGEAEDDGMDFSIEGDFPAFDRPYVRREEREARNGDRQDRPERQERSERADRQDRPERQDRADRTERHGENGNDRTNDRGVERGADRSGSRRRFEDRRTPAAAASPAEAGVDQPVPLEGVRADEGEPVTDLSDNPFIRESRSPRGPRQQRTERRPRRSAVVSEGLDPASLPPAIGVRSESAAEAPAPAPAPAPVAEPASEAPAEGAPAPKRRGRPRKNPLPESAEG